MAKAQPQPVPVVIGRRSLGVPTASMRVEVVSGDDHLPPTDPPTLVERLVDIMDWIEPVLQAFGLYRSRPHPAAGK